MAHMWRLSDSNMAMLAWSRAGKCMRTMWSSSNSLCGPPHLTRSEVHSCGAAADACAL